MSKKAKGNSGINTESFNHLSTRVVSNIAAYKSDMLLQEVLKNGD